MRSMLCFLLLTGIAGCSTTDDNPAATKNTFLSPGPMTLSRIGRTAVRISWVDRSDAESGYQIERKMNNGSFGLRMFTAEDMQSVVDSTDLRTDSTYYYRVATRRISSISDYANVDSIRFTLPYP